MPTKEAKNNMKVNYNFPEITHLVPKPIMTAGVSEPVVSLDGMWKISRDANQEKWEDIKVPSFMSSRRRAMPGEATRYTCKRTVTVNEEWAGNSLYLRFETVNGFSQIFIDGQLAGEHKNGFLAFGMDITPYVQGKKEFEITVVIDELADKVSTFSMGGILRSVALYVLPENYFTFVYARTTFDHQYRHANLGLSYSLNAADENIVITADLYDPMGLHIVEEKVLSVFGSDDIKVENPLKWDSEHPWLYTLKLKVAQIIEGYTCFIEETELKIGFRQIDRLGNRLLVNGQEVKLRGACRHEVSALDGRCLTPEMIREDIALFKEANCNYIRTSHYPPSEYFLDLCDEYGIYVENELPLAFIARTLDYTQRDPVHTDRYLSVFSDIYTRDTNHPSVLMWSLCNESFGGHNFDLLNRYAQEIDPTRPTKFSYPMTMREEHAPIDIWSIHYSNLNEDLAEKKDNVSVAGAPGKDMPVLHDEFAHVPCYNRTEHRRDPHVRTFWGEGLAKFWDAIWNTEGALGGAIWCGIDEIDIYWGGETRLEWGIIDIWRRRKPEHYMTRKAYSPIVAYLAPNENDEPVSIYIENRFCHTNLKEVTIAWEYGEESGQLNGPDAPPRAMEQLVLPINPKPGTKLKLEFIDTLGDIVDEYLFIPVEALRVISSNKKAALQVNQNAESITVIGEDFALCFSKETCLIESGEAHGEAIISGGPILHTPYFRLGTWQPEGIEVVPDGDLVQVNIKGTYENTAKVSFVLDVKPDGTIRTTYAIDKLLRQLPRREKLRVGVDCGGLDELGVAFLSVSQVDSLYWNREGLYTIYPDDHISRNKGIAPRFTTDEPFGEEPNLPWGLDARNVILNGKYDVTYKGPADFRSLKEDIYSASLYRDGGKAALTAVSDGNHSLRLEVEEPKDLLVNATDITYTGHWDAVEEYRGSTSGIEMWSKVPGATAEIEFTGTGIVWYGPVDTFYGKAKVYLDGKLVDDNLSQKIHGVDFPGSAAGYDKKYGFPVYSAEGLAEGTHTLKIEVSEGYIVIDHFRILRQKVEERVIFAVLNDFNYPHIAWGNYTKPAIIVEDGYSNYVTIKLGAPPEVDL